MGVGGLHCRDYLAEVGETELLEICTRGSSDCKLDAQPCCLNANPVSDLGSSLQFLVQILVRVWAQIQLHTQFSGSEYGFGSGSHPHTIPRFRFRFKLHFAIPKPVQHNTTFLFVRKSAHELSCTLLPQKLNPSPEDDSNPNSPIQSKAQTPIPTPAG